jgi:hypothetical protein
VDDTEDVATAMAWRIVDSVSAVDDVDCCTNRLGDLLQ